VVPLAKLLVLAAAIISAPCPDAPRAEGCAISASRVVYVRPDAVGRTYIMAHELGHLVDDWRMTPHLRGRFKASLGWHHWSRESFANEVALCADTGRNAWRPKSREGCRIILRSLTPNI
jgi:hypothetical protein